MHFHSSHAKTNAFFSDLLKCIYVFGILIANKTARTYQTYCTYAAGKPEGQADTLAQEVWTHHTLVLRCGPDPGGRSLEMVRQSAEVCFLLASLKLVSGKDRMAKIT